MLFVGVCPPFLPVGFVACSFLLDISLDYMFNYLKEINILEKYSFITFWI